jgi:hypothetical protein
MCDENQIEDENHLYVCLHTIELFPLIKEQTAVYLSEAITQARTRNNTIQDISSERLMTLTDMTTEAFLLKNLAKGIITKHDTSKLAAETDIKTQSIWLPMIVGSFMKAIYHNIWKIRNSRIEREIKRIKYQKLLQENSDKKERSRRRKQTLNKLKLKRKHREQVNEAEDNSNHRRKRIIVTKVLITKRPNHIINNKENKQAPARRSEVKTVLIINKPPPSIQNNSRNIEQIKDYPERKRKRPPDKAQTVEDRKKQRINFIEG